MLGSRGNVWAVEMMTERLEGNGVDLKARPKGSSGLLPGRDSLEEGVMASHS